MGNITMIHFKFLDHFQYQFLNFTVTNNMQTICLLPIGV